MLEASRLARNNSDWYRLMEICGVSATRVKPFQNVTFGCAVKPSKM
jgi:hypothetical protein